MKFCGECGAPLQTPSNTAEGEHRQLTVLFCDLVDSTGLSQHLDAEDLQTVVRAYQSAASEAITRWNGHIAQYLGDGLLVYFGYPQAHENAAERAVRAGLDIVAALEDVNEQLQTDHGIRLSARVGIHTGAVVIGAMGSGARSEVLALGDTTNIAARVEAQAAPDSVLITAATQQLITGMFVIEEQGLQTLKGVREPTRLYKVVQPSGVRSRLAVAAGRLTQFVGREVEFATLVDRWERAQDGEGQSVLVVGEAGLGKSRVVYQLHEHLVATPHTWLECGATPYTEGTPFYPIIALVEQGLAFAPDDDVTEKLRKLEAGLRTLATDETVALVASFLGLPPATELQLSPELQRRKTIELLLHWTLTLSESQPLVMFVEDLHWCDASTLEFLGQVMAQSATAQVLLIATTRPEFTAPWPTRSTQTIVQLARLTKRQANKLVSAIGGTELPADTRDALVARADGVPLYLEELTRAVTESGAELGVEAIPASLADSLMARLDKLADAKGVAQRAAVLGRDFSYALLAAMVELDESALREGLARLVDAEILFVRGEPPQSSYTFKHALLQDAAYGSLLKRTRQQLHARITQILEERFPERIESEPEVIARHYDRAGLLENAITHYQRAGVRASQRSANEEAVAHLRRALALVDTLAESPERNQLELGLQMAIGAPLAASRSWSHPDYERASRRARELVSEMGSFPELASVLVALSQAPYVQGEVGAATEIASEALAEAERSDNSYDRLCAHYQMGMPLMNQGHYAQALDHFDNCIHLYDPATHVERANASDINRGIAAQHFRSSCLIYQGYPEQAMQVIEAGTQLAKASGHPVNFANAQACHLIVLDQLHEYHRVLDLANKAIEFAGHIGLPFYLAFATVYRGWAQVKVGQGDAGLVEARMAHEAMAASGSGLLAPLRHWLLADCLCSLDRWQEALDETDAGLAQADALGQHGFYADLYRMRAEILLASNGTTGQAPEAHFWQALDIARQQEARTFELRAATGLARLWQANGDSAKAHALLAPVYDWFTEGLDTADLMKARSLLDELTETARP